MPDTAAAATELLNAPDPATPALDAPATPSDSAPPTPAATPATPAFLEVNDRTRYATKEDAIKGWNESQARITNLSQWEQVIAAPLDKGGFGITDPKQVAQLLDELANIRAERAAQPTSSAASGTRTDAQTVQAAASGDKNAYDSLTPEWKQHVDFLTTKLGFVTQDALKPLQEKVDRFDQAQQKAQEERRTEAISNGEFILNGLVEKAGLVADEATTRMIANAITEDVNSVSLDKQGNIIPGSPADRFIHGTAAERTAIIEKGLKSFLDFGERFASAKSASYVKDKTASQASQPRTLPQNTPPASTTRTGPRTEDERKKALAELLSAGGMS